MTTVGLFFGSFNPIHIGHLVIANYILAFTETDQIWFVVSPQNPFKKKQSLLNANDRLHLVNLAIDKNPDYRSCDIEFRMPQPSYTIDTLVRLSERYPGSRFSIIMGSDNLESFRKWKNHDQIIANYHRFIYPRPDTPPALLENIPNATIVNAPLMEISSSFIRQAIAQKKEIPFFMPEKVYHYITEMHYYK